MTGKTIEEINFTVFVINKLAAAWGISTPEVYSLLQRANILEGYVIPCYETLHSLGGESLVDDLTSLAYERGVLQ